MQINLNPTSERGASRDAVNRPRETLGDSHLISSDPRSRFGLVCDLLCCRGNIRTRLPMAKSEEPGDPGQGKLPEGLADPLKMPATSPSSTPGRAGSPWARRLTIAGLFFLVLLLLAIGLAWVWVRHILRKPAQAIRHDPGFGSAREDPDRPRRAGNPHDPGRAPR